MRSTPIRVVLVEDSPIALVILKRLLADTADIIVVGTARTGLEALAIIPQAQPDVICTDLHMPQMGGLELTRRLMIEFPRPILVVSASVQADDTSKVFELLEAGAVDVFPKPPSGLSADYEQIKQALINKIRVLAGVRVFTQHRRTSTVPPTTSPPAAPAGRTPRLQEAAPVTPPPPLRFNTAAAKLDIRLPRVVAIGASTGGPNALHQIFRSLPANWPVPILCVQHISEGFLQGLVDWLDRESALTIKVAQPGEVPQAGIVYFAPEQQHLELDNGGRLRYTNTPLMDGHRPSVTTLFKSVSTFYRRSVVAVLLTGMGRDGAAGLLTVAQAGGITIAQDEVTSVVFGMPREAIALGAAQSILPIDAISDRLISIFSSAPDPS